MKEITKLPWKMKKEEYKQWSYEQSSSRLPRHTTMGDEVAELWHKKRIKDALSESKPVPYYVLKEYKGEKWADKALLKLKAKKKRKGKTRKEQIQMQDAEIIIGNVYAVKVSGKLVPVRIYHHCKRRGWYGRNLRTNRSIIFPTAVRLGKDLTDIYGNTYERQCKIRGIELPF